MKNENDQWNRPPDQTNFSTIKDNKEDIQKELNNKLDDEQKE